MSSASEFDMECGGLDTAFAQRGSTRWLDRGSVPSSRHLKKRRQAARTPYRHSVLRSELRALASLRFKHSERARAR